MKKLFKNRRILSEEEKKKRKNERYLLILSGILLGISFPPFPFPLTILIFFALVPYLYVIGQRKSLADINRATYLTFFVFSVITLYWVGSWQKEADPFLMIAGGVLLFFNPLVFMIPSTLLYLARNVFNKKVALFLFPLFWVTYEYLYMPTDLHFPWLVLGNGLAKFTVFIQIADVIGAVGLSIIVVYINIFIYKAFLEFRREKKEFVFNALIGFMIFFLVLGYGFFRMSEFKISNKKIRVGLIQPNINPWEKWSGGSLEDLTKNYLSLSKSAAQEGAHLIIWPETAYPVYLLSGGYQSTVDTIYNFLKTNDSYLLTGMPDIRLYSKEDKKPYDVKYNRQGDYYYAMYNAILMLSPDTRKLQRYGKMKLVPFGEGVPFSNRIPLLSDLIKWGVGLSGWNIGIDTVNFKMPLRPIEDFKVDAKTDSVKIDGLICFESIFPIHVADFVQRGAQMIAVVTNDSWYGNSSGPYQHEDISILRAVENRRSVVRAANGGISCIIDPLGRIVSHTKMFTRTELTGDVALETQKTFFTEHSLLIPVLSSLFSLWVFGIFILKKLKIKK